MRIQVIVKPFVLDQLFTSSKICISSIFGYLQGYFTKNLFIATQSPLAATVVDFWRMIWERRSPIVVMVMERGVERYWPVDRIKNCNHLSVEPTTERHSVDYTYREFKLTHATVSVCVHACMCDCLCVCMHGVSECTHACGLRVSMRVFISLIV